MYDIHRPKPISAFVQRVWPRVDADQPGETFMAGKWVAFPWLCRILSLGILILNAYRIKWLTVIFVFVYFALDIGLHWVLKYASYDRRRIAYPMALCACFTLFSLIATMFGQGIIEATYAARQLADDEYKTKYAEFKIERASYETWAAGQEQIRERREERQIRKDQARERADREAARKARAALALLRESGRTVAVSDIASEGSEETDRSDQGEPRKAPVEPKAPEETAAQFLARWLFWMKVVQFGDLAWIAVGLSWLLFASIELNIKEKPHRESPSNLPVEVSPSLSPEDAAMMLFLLRWEQQKSGEEISFGEVSPEESGRLEVSPSAEREEEMDPDPLETLEMISFPANNLSTGETVSHALRAEISALVSQKIAERDFWDAISFPAHEVSVGETMVSEVTSNSLPEGDSEGTFTICGGDFKLKQKRKNEKPMGFDLRYAHPAPGIKRDVCYVNQTLGLEIIGADVAGQRAIVDRLRKEKETPLRLVASA